jgi:hypothetical protein
LKVAIPGTNDVLNDAIAACDAQLSVWSATVITNGITVTHRSKAINLIEKDDGWLVALGLLKQQPQLFLCLPNPFAQQIRTLSHVECHLSLSITCNM